MANHNSIIQRIKDLVGDDITDIISYKDLINSGFNFVADSIPATSELWQSPRTAYATLVVASKAKILRIMRKDDSESFFRVCRELTLAEFKKGQDVSSIFYTAGNFKEPVYTITQSGTVSVSPNATTGDLAMYYFNYYDNEDLTGDSLTSLFSQDYEFFPDEALYLGILKASLNLIQARISIAVQDDEDSEILSLLSAQAQTLDNEWSAEAQRINMPTTQVGGQTEAAGG